MNTKRFIMIVLMFALAFVSAGCRQAASQGPASGTATSQPPVPETVAPGQNMGDLGTQTAIAQQPAPAVTSTPETQQQEQPQPQPQQPAATNIVPTVPETRPATYKLQKGEFPYCLARRFNVSVGELLTLNGLSNSSRTYVGQELKIPQSGSFPGERALRTHPADYTVQTGDTIYTVACYYGNVYPESIAAANGLSDPYTLTAGNKIKIP